MSKKIITTGESSIQAVISPDEASGELTVIVNFEPDKTTEDKKAIMDKLYEAASEIVKEYN